MPSRPKTPASSVPGLGLLAGQQPVARLDDRDLAPKRANTWASSTPMAPPPSTISDSGTSLGLDRLAVGPVRRAGQAVDRRDRPARCRC